MKILLIGNTMWSFYNFRVDLIKNIIGLGHQVYILAPMDSSVNNLKNIPGCKLLDINISRKGINPIYEILLLFKIYSKIKEVKPDLIFNYTIKPIIYGSIASWLAGVKNIAVTTGLGYIAINKNLVSTISRYLYKLSLIFSNEVWFLNDDDQSYFISLRLVDNNKARILPGEGIDVDYFSNHHFKPFFSESFSFLLIARMLSDKGIFEFVEAGRRIKNCFPGCKFILMGDIDTGNPNSIKKEQLEAWKKEGVIDYLPFEHDVRPFINKANCVVLPSYREGIPRTLLEASAMSKVVIASNVPGCKDVVINGETGFLCEPKNVDSLVDTCTYVLGLKPSELLLIGRNGRNYVTNKYANEIVFDFYKKVIMKYKV
ncbi:glycosyltransferase family 4 protein [Aeromonas allosaccharophila]|uniref:Glycosyltransferase family 4 protein n=1 Tax=Aeromonas allosaccharophila TaxID=656 RepID=A0A7T2PFZ6_9GAMM|nr:glycosyltransferase family 4 protein [Aeromonas allosaccharophila]QPR55096.1 glycosyltransferase family 4 protein [Aeromonas allosaccharophila]